MLKIKLNQILYLLGIIFLYQISANAQYNISYNKDIDDFLDRCEANGLIEINLHQKPFSRQRIYQYLKEIEGKSVTLSPVMKEKLNFYIKEFQVKSESENFIFLSNNSSGSFRFFEFEDKNSRFLLYPNIGGGIFFRDAKNDLLYYNGLSIYGNLDSYFSFDFNYKDISLRRHSDNRELIFYNRRGWDYQKYFKSTSTNNYDITRGNISFASDKFIFSLSKDYIYLGTGYDGRLILSDKAPSFPHLSIKIFPWSWMEFNYFYGSLNSMYYDSSSIRYTSDTRPHISLIEKYIAAHMLSLRFNDLNFSIGESIIISDRFEPIYLIPVLFFRLADHYLSKTDYNSGNAQIFSSFSYRFPAFKSRFDLTVFIDEMNITNKDGPDAIAYSMGFTKYDIFFENNGAQIEYIRIDPFVYTHADPVQWYSNRNYNLGHWLGNNTDRIFLRFFLTPVARLKAVFDFQYIRKGEIETPNKPRYQNDQGFLYGKKSYYTLSNFQLSYQFLNNLYVLLDLGLSNAWGENDLLNIDDYKFKMISFGLSYGFD